MTRMSDHFADRLQGAVEARNTAAVVGLDPVLARLPEELRPQGELTPAAAADALEAFCREVIAAVAPHVPAVKINSAFFEAYYEAGVAAYFRLVRAAHDHDLLVIGDIKRGDIGSTAELYAQGHLAAPTLLDVPAGAVPDAVTLAGYLGENAVRPFIEHARRENRGVYILVRPSDPGADVVHEFGGREPFYEFMAGLVDKWGNDRDLLGDNGWSCVGAVVAVKDPDSTQTLRRRMPHTPWLVPGYGAQGGTADGCKCCFGRDGLGAVVNASRSVIFAFSQPDYRHEFGDNWRAAISAAAEAFAADIRGAMR